MVTRVSSRHGSETTIMLFRLTLILFCLFSNSIVMWFYHNVIILHRSMGICVSSRHGSETTKMLFRLTLILFCLFSNSNVMWFYLNVIILHRSMGICVSSPLQEFRFLLIWGIFRSVVGYNDLYPYDIAFKGTKYLSLQQYIVFKGMIIFLAQIIFFNL